MICPYCNKPIDMAHEMSMLACTNIDKQHDWTWDDKLGRFVPTPKEIAISIKIESCQQCPYFLQSSNTFNFGFCQKLDSTAIKEIDEIPDWCPYIAS